MRILQQLSSLSAVGAWSYLLSTLFSLGYVVMPLLWLMKRFAPRGSRTRRAARACYDEVACCLRWSVGVLLILVTLLSLFAMFYRGLTPLELTRAVSAQLATYW